MSLRPQDCRLDEFDAVVDQQVELGDYPLADTVAGGALVYRAATLEVAAATAAGESAVLSELAMALSAGPGIVVVRGAVDPAAVDAVSAAFRRIIEQERRAAAGRGDHFGKPGANDRVWNALEKLAVLDADAFVAYYASAAVSLGARAWLGPAFQMTSQVNVVNPGGEAQLPHRDYHLGFMTDDDAARYPAHVHTLSPLLTLQGAVAHVETPVESGPTKFLAHSHKYAAGYVAWRRADFVEYFEEHFAQVPLRIGDLVYFNPALFHAAGTNRTAHIHRMVNLLQVNSAFGRAMESVDRARMVAAVYPALRNARRAGTDLRLLGNALACCAEGYAFPSNLDRDQPVDRLTPESQAEVVWRALLDDADDVDVAAAVAAHGARRLTH